MQTTLYGSRRLRGIAATCALLLGLLHGGRALAANGDCGQPFSNGVKPVTTDALFVLRAGLGLETCDLCVCDINNNGTISSTDALMDLGVAVGQPIGLDCPSCGGTTTTTLPGCPSAGGLDGVVFNEVYSCAQSFTGQPDFCADDNDTDAIRFTHTGDGTYEIRDEPDTGFVYNGTLSCTTLAWIASSPDGYTESGTWNFEPDLESFTGSSTYLADDFSYQGTCNETGAASPSTPPNPVPVPPCN